MHTKFINQIDRKVNQFEDKNRNNRRLLGNHFAAITCSVAAAISDFSIWNFRIDAEWLLPSIQNTHPQR